ncbi:type II toxin-antitoxin system Phd/YefM family antitoxin [Aquisphaera insulae]|uniref:type II toxin-antitoxin system Phd/YefM family antitoxin n=1 Tax=Aquisphaera insulae TaxID=2712864 RepID=UPI00196B5CE0|nr:DUF2281 domain-containing protein [Aquisphaera insulae]
MLDLLQAVYLVNATRSRKQRSRTFGKLEHSKRSPKTGMVKREGSDTMPTVSLEEAKKDLDELIHKLTPAEELLITENDQIVARLVAVTPPKKREPRRLGTLKGTVLYMAPDFDAPLDDFKDYMERG